MRSSDPFLRETLALSFLKNIGPVSFRKLIDLYGSVPEVLRADIHDLNKIPTSHRIDFSPLQDPKGILLDAEKAIEKASQRGIWIISCLDERYPSLLKEIHDPPIVLYGKGDMPDESMPRVAVVGSREASYYGRKMASSIAGDLARAGVVVVSGMALGIDAAAHEGALKASVPTIAVLGGGLLQISPKQNLSLAKRIEKCGVLLSEFPLDEIPRPEYFPRRNRIISGLSQAVVVVEAREKSGALITVDSALEQGRDVYAVPGNVDSSRSGGTNALIKQGAKVATSALDILADIGAASKNGSGDSKARLPLDPKEEIVVRLIRDAGPIQMEEIMEQVDLSPAELMSILSTLLLKKIIKESPGKIFTLA